jgi:hypothetical protein
MVLGLARLVMVAVLLIKSFHFVQAAVGIVVVDCAADVVIIHVTAIGE